MLVYAQLFKDKLLSSFMLSMVAHLTIFLGMFQVFNTKHAPGVGSASIELVSADPYLLPGKKTKPRPVEQVIPKLESESETDIVKKTVSTPVSEGGEAQEGNGLGSGSLEGRSLTPKELYMLRIRERIIKNLIYPPFAKLEGETGLVRVAFTVLKDGTICDVSVQSPSQFHRLNEAAVATLTSLKKLDPLPEELNTDSYKFVSPIQYELN